jgi:putative transposase
MSRTPYPSDLTDDEWQKVQAVLPPAKSGKTGRPRRYPLREIWNAIFYHMRTGCAWRYLPHDFPPYGDVWEHYCRWRSNGTMELVQCILYEGMTTRDSMPPMQSPDTSRESCV